MCILVCVHMTECVHECIYVLMCVHICITVIQLWVGAHIYVHVCMTKYMHD